MTADTEEREARTTLARLVEPGDAVLHRAVAAYGAATVLASLQSGTAEHLRASGASARKLAGILARMELVEEDGEPAVPADVRVLCPGDPEWPTQLDQLAAAEPVGRFPLVPPLCLWVRGCEDLRLAARRSVSVVGARAATAYGEQVASELAAGLAEQGWAVVSGAAYGVDGAAHRAALAVGGTTLAVLACGVDVAYPRAHEALLRRIADAGAVLSELPPGALVSRSRLLQRNRLVAAISRGTVVVEAALRSGTSSTASQASALGRVVMAVPGPVTVATSVGCHELIRSGRAVLVTGAADVTDAVGQIGADEGPVRRGEARPGDDLDPVQLRVLDALPARRGVGIARLAQLAALDLASVRPAIGALLIAGLAEEDATGYRVSPVLRRARR